MKIFKGSTLGWNVNNAKAMPKDKLRNPISLHVYLNPSIIYRGEKRLAIHQVNSKAILSSILPN